MENKLICAVAFIARCAGAATVAYILASSLRLPEAVWAAMSALIVSQERLHDTHSSLSGRILGTLLGIAVTIVVSAVASRLGASMAVQMAVAVAICALAVRKFPRFRVAMWTCPVVLLTAPPSAPIMAAALHRGSEVILGALVGAGFHWAAAIVVAGLTAATPLIAIHGAARHAQGRPVGPADLRHS